MKSMMFIICICILTVICSACISSVNNIPEVEGATNNSADSVTMPADAEMPIEDSFVPPEPEMYEDMPDYYYEDYLEDGMDMYGNEELVGPTEDAFIDALAEWYAYNEQDLLYISGSDRESFATELFEALDDGFIYTSEWSQISDDEFYCELSTQDDNQPVIKLWFTMNEYGEWVKSGKFDSGNISLVGALVKREMDIFMDDFMW